MCHNCCRFWRVPCSLSNKPVTLVTRLCASACTWNPWWWSLESPLAPPERLLYPLSLLLPPPAVCDCSLCSSLRPCVSSSSTDALVALFLSAACSSMSLRAPSRSRGRSRWDKVSWSSSRRDSARAASLAKVSNDSRTWSLKGKNDLHVVRWTYCRILVNQILGKDKTCWWRAVVKSRAVLLNRDKKF